MNRRDRRANKSTKSTGIDPALAAALQEARVLVDRANFPMAEKLFTTLIAKYKDHPRILMPYGLFNLKRSHFDAAEQCFKKLLALEPQNPAALFAMALTKQEQGKTEEALEIAARVRTMDPAPQVWSKLSSFYRNAGKPDEALACIDAAIKKDPYYLTPYFDLHDMRKFTGVDDPLFKNLLEIENRRYNLSRTEQTTLSFTLARAYMHFGDLEKSFAYYERGNAQRKGENLPFPLDQFEAFIDNIINIFNADTVAKLRALKGNESDKPIFIVGVPRCGSTLVEQILSSHPDVSGFGEIAHFANAMPYIDNSHTRTLYPPGTRSISAALIENTNDELIAKVSNLYLQMIEKSAPDGKKHIVDKMLFNYLWVGMIRTFFPNAAIINCTRDPVDTGLSIFMQLFNLGAILFAYNQEDIARYYIGYKKLMDHWNKIFPGQIYEANYEALVADQEGQTRKLLEYCKLPWDARVLKFYENERNVKTASTEQVRKAIYTGSVKKWQKYEQYLQPMIQTLKNAGVLDR